MSKLQRLKRKNWNKIIPFQKQMKAQRQKYLDHLMGIIKTPMFKQEFPEDQEPQ